mmetsp:Transcript_9446/g.17179  ORF Transcript_9446/g.17179 Transcript_9446/m.17179 type:complete len:276 (-) Transcript_9446:137-964(-)
MAPSETLIQPQLLTAAALTWQLLSQAEKRPQIPSHVFIDDVPNLDDTPTSPRPISIVTPGKKRPSVAPHLIAASYDSCSISSPNVMKRVKHYEPKKVVPVVIPESPNTHFMDSAATPPRVARVSAATMRNIQSRQRVLSTMEQYKLKNSDSLSKSPFTPPAVIRESVANCSTPLSDIDSEPTLIRFKVHSKNTVIRFQCEPSFETVQQNIVQRMNFSHQKIIINYKDTDGDYCTLSHDDDLQDAIAAADVMVRLHVEIESKNLFQTAISSLKLGW